MLSQGYSIWIVLLALFVATNGSYIALVGLQRGFYLHGAKRGVIWRLFAGIILAITAWATHFIALLSFRTHDHASYHVGKVILTLCFTAVFIVASIFLFHKENQLRFYLSVALMTMGFLTVHFFGMTALMNGGMSYHMGLTVVAILLALVLCWLHLAWVRRERLGNILSHPQSMRKGLEIGLSIVVFHTAAMFADRHVEWSDLFSTNHSFPHYTSDLVSYLTIATLLLFVGSMMYIVRENRLVRETADISNMKYRSLFFENIEGVLSFTPSGELLQINQAAERLLGYSFEELQNLKWKQLVKPSLLTEVREQLHYSLAGQAVSYETVIVTKNGEERIVLMKHVPMFWNTQIRGVFSLLYDLTEQKRAQQELEQAKQQLERFAFYDALTGVANRRLLNQRIEEFVRFRTHFAVYYLDFDRFKWINDHFSHEAGDEFLKEVGCRLQSLLVEQAIAARLGGDEFVVLLRETEEQKVRAFAEQLLELFQKPFYYKDQQIQTSASIGIALYPQDGASSVELLRNADEALYKVKRNGRNGYQLYSSVEQHKGQIVSS